MKVKGTYKGTRSLNMMIKGMSKSRNSNRPMLVDKPKVKKNKKTTVKVTTHVVTKQSKVTKQSDEIKECGTKNVTVLPKSVQNKMRNTLDTYITNYIPNTVAIIKTADCAFSVTEGVKVRMSDLGISVEDIKELMKKEIGQLHDIKGTLLYSNGYLKIYVNNKNKVTSIAFTEKMKSLIKSKKMMRNEGVNGLLVRMVMEFGELMENDRAYDLFISRAGNIFAMCNNDRVKCKKGDLFLSGHALERMSLRSIGMDDVKKTLDSGTCEFNGGTEVYVGDLCTVVVYNKMIKTVYITLNISEEFGIDQVTSDQYNVIASVYRKEGKPVTDAEMIEKIRVGLGIEK